MRTSAALGLVAALAACAEPPGRPRRRGPARAPRSARLTGSGSLPRYTRVPEPKHATLEPALSEFIETTNGLPAGARSDVPEQTREEMRALGYLE